MPEAGGAAGRDDSGARDGPWTLPGRPLPAQLPHRIPDFTGRDAELGRLDALVTRDDPGAAIVITVITGTAGVGKTALAVHWAHRISDRYPDGQLYVNLRGFDPTGTAVAPAEAIRGFLDAFGSRRSRFRSACRPRRRCTAACSPGGGC